jgi:PAS domain S-box-containing protein
VGSTEPEPLRPPDPWAALGELDAVIWEADPRTIAFLRVGGDLEHVLGWSADEWLETPGSFVAKLHPDDRERVLSAFLTVGTGGRLDVEHRIAARDGSTRWVRSIGHLTGDPSSSVLDRGPVLLGLTIDVTESRGDVDAGRETELRFRRVVERLPVIVYMETAEGPKDAPGSLLYISPQLEEVLGFRPEDWLRDPTAWARQFHPDDLEPSRAVYRKVARGEAPFVADYRMFARDGHIVWFHDEAVMIRDENGRPLFWQGIMQDVTAQHERAPAAEQTSERFQTLVEQLPAIVYSEDVTGDGLQVVYINARVKDVLGIDPKEWIDDPSVWFRMIHPDDRDAVMAENARTEATGDPFSVEYRMIARDGRTVWFKDEARLVFDADGAPSYWQGVMLDITEAHRSRDLERDLQSERRAAERLREADALKDTLLQAVSHDLRSPITSILGMARTLERDDVELSAEDAHGLAGRIAANARKMDRIVANLLDLERLSAGVLEPILMPVDLGALVRELVAGSEAVAERRLDLDTAPLVLHADAAMLERIVENLLGNAAKHTPGDSRIWVRVERADGGALLVVEDDGPGVAAADRERIFEAFSQGASPGTAAGLGVGLAVVARFASLHEGHVWVEDRSGGGASFKVFLADRPVPVTPPPGGDQAGTDSASDANQA